HVEPVGQADGQIDVRDSLVEPDHEKDHHEDGGDAVEDIDDAHHDSVDPPAGIGGDGAVADAKQQVDQPGHEGDEERDAGAGQEAGRQIAPQAVGAGPVAAVGGKVGVLVDLD